MQRHSAMHDVSDEERCAECGHKKGDHASGACAVRLSTGKRDVYCPCAGFRIEEASLRETRKESSTKRQSGR